jgi:dienelactone hydrolase
MRGIARVMRMAAVAVVAAALMVAGGSGSGGSSGLPVTTTVVSEPNTQDIHVVEPQTKGTWPVVLALHGLRGSGEDMVELGTRLARAGTVVFAPTYRSDLTTAEGLANAGNDISCAYQLARRTAPEHGGDLARPLTAVGWSLGADLAVLGSLQPAAGGTGNELCPGQAPRPNIVVGISGCYYEFEGQPVSWFDDLTGLGNKNTDVYLLAGDQDTTCPAWQSEKLASELRAAGHHVELVRLQGANHYAPVFHDLRDGDWQVITHDPAGQQTVEAILDAIAAAGDGP